MKKLNTATGFLFALILCFANVTASGQTAEVAIGGDVAAPFKVNATTIAEMKQVTVPVTDRDGRAHQYTGVLLYDILTKAQAVPNNQLRGKSLTKYALVTAADGYQVVIALPEIDPAYTDQQVILATKEDGEDLPANFGPYRLIVPRDKRPARSAQRVVEIDVLTAKKP